MNERSLPTSDCKLQAFYAINVIMAGCFALLVMTNGCAARNDKADRLLPVLAKLEAVVVFNSRKLSNLS